MNDVGALLQMLRKARGVSLSELHTKRSAASLSRFERGEMDLTYDVLSDMLTTLGVDYHDLMLLGVVSDTAKNDWTHLGDGNWNEASALRLRDYLQSQCVVNTHNPFLEMTIDVISGLIEFHQNHSDQLSLSVVHHVMRYFEELTEYSRVEGIILLAIAEFIPAEKFQVIVSKRIENLHANLESVSESQIRRLISLCSGLAARAGIENNLAVMRQAVDWMMALRKLVSENPISQYNYLVARRLLELKVSDTPETRQRLVAILNTGKVILPAGNFTYFRQYALDEGWLTEADFQ